MPDQPLTEQARIALRTQVFTHITRGNTDAISSIAQADLDAILPDLLSNMQRGAWRTWGVMQMLPPSGGREAFYRDFAPETLTALLKTASPAAVEQALMTSLRGHPGSVIKRFVAYAPPATIKALADALNPGGAAKLCLHLGEGDDWDETTDFLQKWLMVFNRSDLTQEPIKGISGWGSRDSDRHRTDYYSRIAACLMRHRLTQEQLASTLTSDPHLIKFLEKTLLEHARTRFPNTTTCLLDWFMHPRLLKLYVDPSLLWLLYHRDITEAQLKSLCTVVAAGKLPIFLTILVQNEAPQAHWTWVISTCPNDAKTWQLLDDITRAARCFEDPFLGSDPGDWKTAFNHWDIKDNVAWARVLGRLLVTISHRDDTQEKYYLLLSIDRMQASGATLAQDIYHMLQKIGGIWKNEFQQDLLDRFPDLKADDAVVQHSWYPSRSCSTSEIELREFTPTVHSP